MLEPPSGTFDVTVPPGEPVQAAVDRCPPGGCVLLLPGMHDGTLFLAADKVVHVIGRGRATLRTATGTVVTSRAVMSTLDGLIIRHEEGLCGTWIRGGRLRLQACDITSAEPNFPCVFITSGADPVLVSCKCVLAPLFSARPSSRVCERGEMRVCMYTP